jgi:hypothetical protein
MRTVDELLDGDGVDALTQGGQADRQLLEHESRVLTGRAKPRTSYDARLADPIIDA